LDGAIKISFLQLIHLLAQDSKVQVDLLEPLPENAHERGFELKNNAFKALWLYEISFGVYDGSWNESVEHWISRTGLRATDVLKRDTPFWECAAHLRTCIAMMQTIRRPLTYTRQGIRNLPEWKLVRELASQTILSDDSRSYCSAANFDSLLHQLGGSQVDINFACQ
jgi:hypothetical protein